MKSIFYTFSIILAILTTACRKDVGLLPVSDVENPAAQSDTIDFTCVTFPQWFHAPPDSVTNPTQQLMYWQYIPGSKSQIVYSVNSQIWSYNFISNKRVFITDKMEYLADCNRKGWILFSDYRDQGIYKIKTNGDSLTRMTYEGIGGGHWDYSGTAIYYFSEATNMLYKIDENGKKLDSVPNVPVGFTAFSKKSDKLYYGKGINGVFSIVCLDFSTKNETIVCDYLGGELSIDNRDENIYVRSFDDPKWALIKYNIPTKKIDTLLKNCDNYYFTSPYISANTDNKMTIGCLFAKFLDPKVDPTIKKPRILRWTKAFEINVDDPKQKLKEVNLFPE